ncbi:MAG TPA: hypothetical protein VFM71_04070 [Gemmatimonadaceae bacterium]|nr:hypothetical protein [Gemmatimonadaceae bacterium]
MSITEPPRIARFTVRRFARCAVRGPSDPAAVRELWIVLHGYGQLATEFAAIFGPQNVDDGTRLIVAPEGLSRFYDARSKPEAHAEASVGASWMTREERTFEIEDQIAWLQQAFEAFVGPLPRTVPVTVLGFSQGVAAASRWVASGQVHASRLICWGAALAPELDIGPASPLRRSQLYLVLGLRDRYASPERVTAERARLDAAGLPYRFLSFEGGHRLDDATLKAIAADGTAP